MANLKSLKEERAGVLKQMEDLSKTAQAENRNMTTDEAQKVNSLYDRSAELRDMIKAEERTAEIRAEISEKVEQAADRNKESKDEARAKVNEAFRNLFMNRMSSEDRNVLNRFESRATDQSKTNSEGGYTVPQGFQAELEKTMAYYGPLLDAGLVRVWNTPNGIDIPWPSTDDTSNKASKVSEGSSVAGGTAAVFGSKTFKAYKYSTNLVKYTPELLADSAFDFSMILAELFGERMGRGLNYAFTKGVGTTDVQGVVVGASAGKTTAAELAITQSELLDLIHSLDVAYRNNAKLMMNDATYKYLYNLALTTDIKQINWLTPSNMANTPAMMFGYQVLINNDMDNIGAGNVPVVFGDFKKYVTRFAGPQTFKTLYELYAATDEYAAIMFQRVDGQVLNANAFKKLTMNNT